MTAESGLAPAVVADDGKESTLANRQEHVGKHKNPSASQMALTTPKKDGGEPLLCRSGIENRKSRSRTLQDETSLPSVISIVSTTENAYQKRNVVELAGLEPATLCLQSRCATNCAIAPRDSLKRYEVGSPGFEPGTSSLSGMRSNQLSYEPNTCASNARS